MFITVTFLTLLSEIPFGITENNTCVPNTRFVVNDSLCFCNNTGQWADNNCQVITRRYSCSPGQIIWHGCSQCICQENRKLLCSNVKCFEDTTALASTLQRNLDSIGPWCTPFKSYYINCNICVCPASGRASEARCTVDWSCSTKRMTHSDIISINTFCIPKVMYLFPCLQCLCSEEGLFNLDKCTETCHKQDKRKECAVRTFYRNDCNVCFCSDDSIVNENLCSTKRCNSDFRFFQLKELRNKNRSCTPQTFTEPVCHYCECGADKTTNENKCLEIECIKTSSIKSTSFIDKCSPGEMVAMCMECFCLKNGFTNEEYCSKSCSYEEKLDTLSTVIRDGFINRDIIDLESVKTVFANENTCQANSLYKDHERYCLCPENRNANFKLCIQANNIRTVAKKPNSIDFNGRCEPSTFVQFDCNTCFCSKNGTIDPNWCTYDDCLAKKIIKDSHRSHNEPANHIVSGACSSGSISKFDCNFCICSDNGRSEDRVCTKNDCNDVEKIVTNESFTCEPLTYYEVDCNICYCPRDGLQNVARCTKNICEKSFLRSASCIPGQLFGDECNVCVCPPNGDKSGKVCTNHTCDDNPTWKKIFKISESLLKNQISENSPRSLDLCFPGEEFAVGCDLCVCPDMGLKSYATCTPILCGENRIGDKYPVDPVTNSVSTGGIEPVRVRRHSYSPTPYPSRVDEAKVHQDGCLTYNVSDSAERKDCSPGSVYIIRCRECICPYMGNINYFCRDLPKNMFCEKAFPNFNYMPMGRRISEGQPPNKTMKQVTVKHEKHTKYACKKPGKVMDECFVCDCLDEGTIIYEHCFKSDDKKCVDAKPSFLSDDYKVVLT